MSSSDEIKVLKWDLIDIVNLCNSALAQDSPNPPSYYVNQIMSMTFGYCDKNMRSEIDEFLAEKKYIPPVKLVDPHEEKANEAAKIIFND